METVTVNHCDRNNINDNNNNIHQMIYSRIAILCNINLSLPIFLNLENVHDINMLKAVGGPQTSSIVNPSVAECNTIGIRLEHHVLCGGTKA